MLSLIIVYDLLGKKRLREVRIQEVRDSDEKSGKRRNKGGERVKSGRKGSHNSIDK